MRIKFIIPLLVFFAACFIPQKLHIRPNRYAVQDEVSFVFDGIEAEQLYQNALKALSKIEDIRIIETQTSPFKVEAVMNYLGKDQENAYTFKFLIEEFQYFSKMRIQTLSYRAKPFSPNPIFEIFKKNLGKVFLEEVPSDATFQAAL